MSHRNPWLAEIDSAELRQLIPVPGSDPIDIDGTSLDALGTAVEANILDGTGAAPSDDVFGWGRKRAYWKQVKWEFHLFLCTDEKKYAGLRGALHKKGSCATTVVISTISAALAAKIGTVAGVITPLVAVCLYAVARIGINAFCAISGDERSCM